MSDKVNKKRTIRENIQYYMIDVEATTGKVIEILFIFLNLIVCAIFVIETYPINDNFLNFLWNLETIIIGFFIIEYLARLYGANDRLKYIFNIYSIIDLLSILPTILLFIFQADPSSISMLMIIRILRITRIFRFLRFTSTSTFFFGDISITLLKVLRLVLTILIIFFIASGLFYLVENSINDNVENFGDAFYFTVVALTTVGFGDIIPLSGWGKAVTVSSILSGIVLIPWQASQIMKEWMNIGHKKIIVCSNCGLRYHDKDASHCKSCGNIIFQEFDGY